MSEMKKTRVPWHITGTWYEACAAEGLCSMYFGRDMEAPCKTFQLLEINDGQIGDTSVSGLKVIVVVDLFSSKFADFSAKGGEGGIYIDDDATAEQKELIEPFISKNIPGFFPLRKTLGIRQVKIELERENNTFHVSMPHGEMRQSFTLGGNGTSPQRLDNSLVDSWFSDIKICNTHFWKYDDFGKHWEFENRSGLIAEFNLQGKAKLP